MKNKKQEKTKNGKKKRRKKKEKRAPKGFTFNNPEMDPQIDFFIRTCKRNRDEIEARKK